MISYGVSSNLAYIENIDDIKKIIALFEDERLVKSDSSCYSGSFRSFRVSFYNNDLSTSTRTIEVFDNMHIINRNDTEICNYIIDDATIYNDILYYYDKYKHNF